MEEEGHHKQSSFCPFITPRHHPCASEVSRFSCLLNTTQIHDGTPNRIDSHPSTPLEMNSSVYFSPLPKSSSTHSIQTPFSIPPISPPVSYPFHVLPRSPPPFLLHSILSSPVIQFHYSLSSPLLHFSLSLIPQSLSLIPPHPSISTSHTPISSQSNHHHTITLQTPSLKSPSQL